MYNAIFQQPWWLDAVAPNHWDAVVLERGGEPVARLPYVIRTRRRMTELIMPPLTQTLGPWLRPSKGKLSRQLTEQKDLMNDLIQKLPPFDFFIQNFHYSITNWLPFYWNGFEQTTRYTYVLDDLRDPEKLWEGLASNIRREIKKAQNRFHLTITSDCDITVFMDLNEQTFQRQGTDPPYTREIVQRLDAACALRQARKMFFAIDEDGCTHAAVYIVWDERSTYYLMGGSDPELRTSGATSLCMWEAIKFAATVTERFDFEGSMIEPVERFFRAFGAKQTPYFQVSKINSRLLKCYRDVKTWLQ